MDMQFGQDDWLSRFQDEILQQILSKLPFAEAVQSSIISHRWMRLWTGIPNVELKQKEAEPLLEFLNRGILILERRSVAPIEKLDFGIRNLFELLQHPDYSIATREFVASALGSQLKEITLDFATDSPGYSDNKIRCNCPEASRYYVMSGIYLSLHFKLSRLNGCPLRILKLKDCKIDISDYQNFAGIEILWLTRVYPTKGTVQQMVHGLTSACTGLTVFGLEFYLLPDKKCATLPVENLKITCPQLECLTLKCCHCLDSIEVDAPKLKYFEFKGELHERCTFHLVNSPDLVSATFILSRSGEHFPVFSGAIAAKFIKQIAHAKFMTVTFYDTKDVIMMRNQRSPTPVVFSRLKKLKIERNVEDNISLEEVLCFIRASPLLERLYISLSDGVTQMENFKGDAWLDNKRVVTYNLGTKIRQIEISGFRGSMFHFMLVKLLVEHTRTLEEVTIHGCLASYSVHSRILRKLMQISSNPNIKLTYV